MLHNIYFFWKLATFNSKMKLKCPIAQKPVSLQLGVTLLNIIFFNNNLYKAHTMIIVINELTH